MAEISLSRTDTACFIFLIAALVNDTVGTLLAHSYTHPNTFVGAIFGTGTNGAYVEDACNIPSVSSDAKEMLINIEWGNFDKDKEFLPLTIHDNKLDRESIVSFIIQDRPSLDVFRVTIFLKAATLCQY